MPRSMVDEIDLQETVGDEQQFDVGLFQAVLHFVGLEAGVHRHGDRADARGGVEENHPFQRIAHAHRDMVAAD